MKRIVIIGAGASGLACASTLIKEKVVAEIYIIDKNKEIGKKLHVTGNGRCNLSNANINKTAYHGDIDAFFEVAQNFNVLSYFEELGLVCRQIDDLYYPYSLQAKSVSNIFHYHLNKRVTLWLDQEVISIEQSEESYLIKTTKQSITADYVVLATGGKAGWNTAKAGYDLLKQLKISYQPLFPSLVQIETENAFSSLKGTRVKATISLVKKAEIVRKETGEVLFTEDGLSGIAVFQLTSQFSSNDFTDYTVILDMFPDFTIQQLSNLLKRQLKIFKNNQLSIALLGLLPHILCNEVKKMIGCEEINYTNCTTIANQLKNLTFAVKATRGFSFAQVTKGGVSKLDVNPNLSLKKYPTIFVCGELLNIDGDCGGFNLHFAFASGDFVAKKIIAENR